ncbi:MAG: hypothetical protein KDD50_10770 [Bdellovibrionales bacterium]|nr:hypothetical protein [Bdellovibrionales bacterium]
MKMDPPEKDKRKLLIRGLLTAIGVLLLFWGLKGKWNQINDQLQDVRPKSSAQTSNEELWSVLKSESSDQNKRGSALLTLTQRKQETHSYINTFLQSENDSLKRWGLLSLTVDYAKNKDQVLKYINSDNRSLRIIVYKNLAKDSSEEGKKLLKNLKKDSAYFNEDRTIVLQALYKKSSNKEKEKIIKELVQKSDSKDLLSAREATIALAQLAPDDEKVKKNFRTLLLKSKHDRVRSLALSYLTNQRDQYLSKNLGFLINDKNRLIRSQAIKTIPMLCPRQKWKWLNDRIRKESNKDIQWEIVQTAININPDGAKNFLEGLEDIKSLAPDFKLKLNKFLKELDFKKIKTSCD